MKVNVTQFDPASDVLGIHRLTSALAADALDDLGWREQCLGPDIRPLRLDQKMVGRAFTVTSQPAVDEHPERPYEGLLQALDVLPSGAIFVFHTQRSNAAGVWGELITTACQAGGVLGALTDGLIRDVPRLLELNFPVFSRGATPYDSKGRVDVTAHNVPITVDGVQICSGDLIVGDADGVCVIPAALEQQVLERVRIKHDDEGQFRTAVASGTSVSAAFRRYGIL